MKLKPIPISILTALFVALCAFHPRIARAQDEVSPDFFYDSLSPYGEWVDVGDYGPCWHPAGVDENWAPYTDGYWAYTDAGWTWVSYEDFGGVVYHYGRWMRVDGEGWCWKPGYEWAPAWVSWRRNEEYIGWAPLPPEARWRGDIGFSVWVDSEFDIGPGYYSFCRFRDFGAPVLRPVIIDPAQNFVLIGKTRNITNMTYTNFGGARVIFNGGPNFAALRGVTAHPIPALTLVQNSHFDPAQLHGPGAGRLIASRTAGNQLIVAAPLVAAPADPNFLKGKTTKVIAAGKVTKGWSGVKDPAAAQQLRQQIQAQTKGVMPETAHARPVAAAELKLVPAHAHTVAADPAVVAKPAVVPAAVVPHVNPPKENPAFVEKPEIHKPTAPAPREAITQPQPHVVPREAPHSFPPTPAPANNVKKGNAPPPGKDKDKDKKDKDRPGN